MSQGWQANNPIRPKISCHLMGDVMPLERDSIGDILLEIEFSGEEDDEALRPSALRDPGAPTATKWSGTASPTCLSELCALRPWQDEPETVRTLHFGSNHFGSSNFHSKSQCCSTQGEVGCLVCVCCRDPGDCLFLVCSVAIPATVFPSCLCGLAALVSRQVFWLGMGGDGFQTQTKSWVPGQVRAERVLADAFTTDGRKRVGMQVLFRNECVDAGSVADGAGTTSPWVCKAGTSRRFMRRIKKGTLAHRPRVGEKNGSLRVRKKRSINRLRAQVELLSKQQGTEKSLEEPGELARRGSGLEDGWKTEFDEETDCKKKLNEHKKSLRRQRREIDKFASMDLVLRDRQKEIRNEELEEIERKRTDLLSEDAEEVTKAAELAG